MKNAGFTLLEMLVVLAVLALVTTLFVPMVGSRKPSAEAGARAMAAAIERARAQAISANTETRFVVDPRRQGDLKVILTVAATEAEGEGRGGFRFYPDGSSSGGAVAFDDGRRVVTVAVDWLTGGIHVR